MSQIGMEWSDERSQQLAKLWADSSLSAAEIAAAMGGGLTRSAVLGRAHRMDLPSRKVMAIRRGDGLSGKRKPRAAPVRTTPFRPLPEPVHAPSPSVAAAPAPCFDVEVPASLGLDILGIGRGQCRYPDPAGNPAIGIPFTFCGHAVAPGSSYCQPHKMICSGVGTLSERNAAHGAATVDRTIVAEAA